MNLRWAQRSFCRFYYDLLYFKAQNTKIDMAMQEDSDWIIFPFGYGTDNEKLMSQIFDSSYGPYNLNFHWTVISAETEVIMVTIMSVTIHNHPNLKGDKKDTLEVISSAPFLPSVCRWQI